MQLQNKKIVSRALALVVLLIGAWTAQAATLTVTNTADSAPGSFRQAILDADADTSTNDVSIEFNIPASGVVTTARRTPLPPIWRTGTLRGNAQPGRVRTSPPAPRHACSLTE